MKKEYIKPTTIESSVLADEIMLSPFSKIDNTGNGGSDGETLSLLRVIQRMTR